MSHKIFEKSQKLEVNTFFKNFHPFQRRRKLEEKEEKGSQLGGNVHPFQNPKEVEGGGRRKKGFHAPFQRSRRLKGEFFGV
jgi:hypothetical protein